MIKTMVVIVSKETVLSTQTWNRLIILMPHMVAINHRTPVSSTGEHHRGLYEISVFQCKWILHEGSAGPNKVCVTFFDEFFSIRFGLHTTR